MAGSIGKLSLQLSVITDAFDKGLNSAGKQVGSFGKQVGSFGKQVGGFGKQIASTALGFAVYDVGKGVFDKVTASIHDAFKSIDDLSKASDRLGVTTEFLSGMAHAADLSNVSFTELETALSKLNIKLGEAQFAGSAAEKEFAKWGLDAQALGKAGLEEAIVAITDRMGELGSAAEKAAFSKEIGKGWQGGLLNLLAEGKVSLREMIKEADQFGLTFSRASGRGVEAMNDALTRIKAVLVGIGRQLAIAIAPVVEKMAVLFTDWVKSLGGVKPMLAEVVRVVRDIAVAVVKSIESMRDAIQNLSDTADILTLKRLRFASTFDESILYQSVKGVNKALEGFAAKSGPAAAMAQFGPPEKTFEDPEAMRALQWQKDRLKDAERASGKLAAGFDKVIAGLLAPPSIAKVGDDGRSAAVTQAESLARALNEQTAAMGLSETQIKLAQFATMGLTDAQTASLRAANQAAKAMAEVGSASAHTGNMFDDQAIKVNRLMEVWRKAGLSAREFTVQENRLAEALQKASETKAGQIIDETRTPLERFKAAMAEVEAISNRVDQVTGKALIDADTKARKVFGLFADLQKTTLPSTQPTPALTRGSQEALSVLTAARNQSRAPDIAGVIRQAAEEQKRLQREQIDKAKDIEKAVKGLGKPQLVEAF